MSRWMVHSEFVPIGEAWTRDRQEFAGIVSQVEEMLVEHGGSASSREDPLRVEATIPVEARSEEHARIAGRVLILSALQLAGLSQWHQALLEAWPV